MKKNLTLLASLGALFMISGKCDKGNEDPEPKSVLSEISEAEKEEYRKAVATINGPEFRENLSKLKEARSKNEKIEKLAVALNVEKDPEEKKKISLALERLQIEWNKLQPEIKKAKEALNNSTDFTAAYKKVDDFTEMFLSKVSKLKVDTHERLSKQKLTEKEKQEKLDAALKPSYDDFKKIERECRANNIDDTEAENDEE